ncbi:MAG: hypothetical protein EBV83_03650 [Verrucomicrobia bacterium]|nr:hypothetical protein [Verrucomicrobiota bacterium]
MSCGFFFCLIMNLVCAQGTNPAAGTATDKPDILQAMEHLKLPAPMAAKIKSGEIVAPEVNDATDKELAVRLVMLVKASPDQLKEFITADNLMGRDPTFSASGQLSAESPKIEGVKLTADEAMDYLNAEPGSDFNFHSDEYAKLKAAKKTVKDDSQAPTVAAKVIGEILTQRFQAYRQAGIGAVAPYDRGGGKFSEPGDELLNSMLASPILQNAAPDAFRAFRDFPGGPASGMVHEFFWSQQKVEDKPAFILSHRMTYPMQHGVIFMDRQYFVSRTYNSMLTGAGCGQVAEGTLIYYVNRTSTDQVAGFMQETKHSVGRKQMREELIKMFEDIRKKAGKGQESR